MGEDEDKCLPDSEVLRLWFGFMNIATGEWDGKVERAIRPEAQESFDTWFERCESWFRYSDEPVQIWHGEDAATIAKDGLEADWPRHKAVLVLDLRATKEQLLRSIEKEFGAIYGWYKQATPAVDQLPEQLGEVLVNARPDVPFLKKVLAIAEAYHSMENFGAPSRNALELWEQEILLKGLVPPEKQIADLQMLAEVKRRAGHGELGIELKDFVGARRAEVARFKDRGKKIAAKVAMGHFPDPNAPPRGSLFPDW